MPKDATGGLFSSFITLATLALAVAILKVAQEIMVPIAIAALLAFLLSPLAERFASWGLGKTLSVLATATLGFILITGVGWLVASQVWSLVKQLPKYEENINAKMSKFRAPHTPIALTRVAEMVQRAEQEITDTPSATDTVAKEPVPVRVESTKKNTLDTVSDLALPVLAPLGSAVIVVVFVIAILFCGDDLRDRFIMLVSSTHLREANQVMNDVARRVFRYLTMQLAINACYGTVIGIALALIGVPQALLWGVLSMLLRFIPFLGPWMAAAFPLVVAFAVDPGWTKLIYTLTLYLVAEAVTANVVEVWLYGATTGISALSLLFAAVFWTWLWGPAGLFLSTPLTVWLMVIARHVPALRFLSFFLESRSPRAILRHAEKAANDRASSPPETDPASASRADRSPNR